MQRVPHRSPDSTEETMGLSVNTNVAALNSYRNLSTTNTQMSKSLEKLSSGFRINRAADDAAGLAISEGLRSQIGGIKVAIRNTQDGISVVQTAEGALTETHSILQRMRDLSVQASNDGSLNGDAKKNIQSEIGQLKSELDRIANTTTFNGKKLLDGNYSTTFQVGANAGETIAVNVGPSMGSTGLGVSGVDVTGTGATTGTETAATDSAAGSVALTFSGAADFGDDDNAGQFAKLSGTVSFGGKTFDLGSVDYSDADGDGDSTTAPTAAQNLTALNKAAKAAFGLADTATDPFAVDTTTAENLVFTAPADVEGFTGASGVALTDSAA